MHPDPVLAGWHTGPRLGEGRRGVVVRCRRDGDPREYALKWVASVDPAVRARFGREIEGLARLDHPNLTKLVDAGVTADAVWLVMDLAEGRPLSALRAPPGLDPALVLGIGRQLADALAHAHARGVHHRDVKPSNAVIAPDGHVVLVDLGVALLDRASGLTLDGHRPGTPVYAPPEWFGDGPVDGAAADVYALGVLLYELAIGGPAFPKAHRDALAPEKSARALVYAARPGSTGPAGDALAAHLRAATDPDPAHRPTARALADALAAWPAVPPPVASTIAASLGLGTASTLDEPVGPRIGRYTVDRELGRGGMGVVYKAHDPLLDRPVAVKRLYVTTDAARARFAREARSVARLDHPGVVRVLDFGADAVGPYFAMAWVDGPDLASALAAGRIDRDRAVAIAIAVGEALAAAHAAGIVHRDVKPANVLLEGGVHPRLSDFGVAAVADETRLTRADGVVGTPAYMAPEQAAGRAVDGRADVYGLGAVLFELLVGEPPGAAGAIPPAVPGVEGPLAAVVRRALEPDVADRYPSMDRFVDDLRRIRDGRPIAGLDLATRLTRAWRRPAVRVAAAIALVVGFAAAVPLATAAVRWGERAAAERAAEARRVGMEAEIARFVAEGHADEADRAFETYATFPAHQGTAALGEAWSAQAARLDARHVAPDDDDAALAWAQAWATAVGPAQQAGALRGLGDALVRIGRPAALGHVVALGADVGPELDGLRRAWSLWRRAPAPQGPGASAVDGLVHRLTTGTQPSWSIGERPAVVDDDGDGLPELFVPTPDALLRLPGGAWLGAAAPTGVGGTAELFPVTVPGVGPMLVANGLGPTDPNLLIALGDDGARVVHAWDAADVSSALGADLDHDGVGELYVATRYPHRTLRVFTVRDGAWTARGLRAPTATNATIDGMVLLEPVAEAGSMVAAFGAYGAYDVRRLVPGADGVALDRRRKVGWPGGLAALRGPNGARWLALGVKRGPPDPFPPDVPGLGDGLFVLDDRFAVLGGETPPTGLCVDPLAADLDGDDLDEVVSRCGVDLLVADVGPTGALDAAHVGAIWPWVAGDADGDGDDDVVAWVGSGADVRAAHVTWVLGAGDAPVPPYAPPPVRPVPPDVDPGLRPWWQRAEELVGMELFEAAEARFEAIARLDVDGESGTRALMRAADLADGRGASGVAADRRTRAADRPSAPPEVVLAAADGFAAQNDLVAAARVLAVWRTRVGPGADDGGRAAAWARGAASPSVDLDVGAPLHPAWRIARPFGIGRHASGRGLRIRSTASGLVARLPVRIVGEKVGVTVDLRADRLEIGSSLVVNLTRDGARVLGLELRAQGGGGEAFSFARGTIGADADAVAMLSSAYDPDDPLAVAVEVSWWVPRQRGAIRVTRPQGVKAAAGALGSPTDGDWWIELRAGFVDGAALDVTLERLALAGLEIRDPGPPTPIEAMRLALASGDPNAAVAAPGDDGPEARALRAVALDDLGRWDEADRELAAAARATPPADVAEIFAPLLFDGPSRLAGAARRGLGDRWPRLFADTFQALGWYHARGERYVTAYTRTLGDLSRAPPPTERAVWAELERQRARAWRQAARVDLAADAARRAVALARGVPRAEAPDQPATTLSGALLEAAIQAVDRDPAAAIAALQEALAAAEAPEVLADRICADPALAPLRGAPGWDRIDAARRSDWPATE